MTTQRSLTEPNNDVAIDMNLLSSDLNVEQLPQSPGGSSLNGSNNNNNENRKLFELCVNLNSYYILINVIKILSTYIILVSCFVDFLLQLYLQI